MERIVDCPICDYGKLHIELAKDEKVIMNGRFGKYPYKAYCKKCHRFIKYNIEKEEKIRV